MDATMAHGLFVAEETDDEGGLVGEDLLWPDFGDAAALLPLPPSPSSSLSNDSYRSGFTSASMPAAVAVAAEAPAAAIVGGAGPRVKAKAKAPPAASTAVPMPRRPRTAYIIFTQAHRERVRKELEVKRGGKLAAGPKVMGKSGKYMNVSNIVTVAIADLWKRLKPQQKRSYEEAAIRDTQRFKMEMVAYKRHQQLLQRQEIRQYVQRRPTSAAAANSSLPPSAAPPAAKATPPTPVQLAPVPPPSPPAQLLSPTPPPMPPRPQKKPAAAAKRKTGAPPGKGAAPIAAVAGGEGASPSMPRKPPGAFLLWSHKPRGELRRQKDPVLDNGAVSRILGSRWKAMAPEEKAPWMALANARLKEYLAEKRAFLEASGAPVPDTSAARNRKQRKAAAEAAAAAGAGEAAAAMAPTGAGSIHPCAASVVSSSSCSSLGSLASNARSSSTTMAAAASGRLPVKGVGEPQPPPSHGLWAARDYVLTGAGLVDTEEQQSPLQQHFGAALGADEAFENDVMSQQEADAFLLLEEMDFSGIADEIFCDSPSSSAVAALVA